MSAIILGEMGQGKLWEFVEISALIGVGSCLAYTFLSMKKYQAVAFSTLNFLVGKTTYGIARGVLQRAGLFSIGTDRIIGWAAAVLAGAYAGKWFTDNRKQQTDYSLSLIITGVGGFLGSVLREVVYYCLTHGVITKGGKPTS